MKISRKQFIKGTLATALGMGVIPKLISRTIHPDSLPEKKILGNTGIEVTTLGFGATRTQEPGVVKAAIQSGMNFLDTGRSYAKGQNEVMLGKVLKGIRGQYVIQSKMKVRLKDGSATAGEIRNQMETSLKESLAALQTDYIDVMLLHIVDKEETLRNETIREVFTEMKRKGMIRACGFSSHSNHVNILKEANKEHFFDVIMVPFNAFGGFKHAYTDWSTSWDQQALIGQMKTAHHKGTGLVAMKTCSGGGYAYHKGDKPSFPGAVSWVRSHRFVDTTAVAMASYEEIREHTQGSNSI
jgi:aryl-alcohol dehydrogenase-like predicted oxidoreductase